MKENYVSPFSERYSSKRMLELFSPDTRYSIWRKLWVSLAKAERALGLEISEEQIKELEENVYNIDYSVVDRYEKLLRHDVMAHIKAYGEVAPKAAGIIHLGATSCFVTDNADLVIYKQALGYTHYQVAQPTTVGKRATLWLQDFESDLRRLNFSLDNLKFLGSRGAVGSEASFSNLFDDDEKADEMNAMIASDFGFFECFDVLRRGKEGSCFATHYRRNLHHGIF